jgi:predicted nucleic acid-binding protein
VVTCCDTSFLFSLYGNDVHTSRSLVHVQQSNKAIQLSILNQFELANAFRFAEFRQAIAPGTASIYQSHFDADVAQGRLPIMVCNLATIINQALFLSAKHTITGGHRSFDILHLATAIHLGATEFLTFDANQKRLAQNEGLTVPL